MTGSDRCVEAVLAVFTAVEQRDQAALARACQPDVEFCWPPSLPYGGVPPDAGHGRRCALPSTALPACSLGEQGNRAAGNVLAWRARPFLAGL